MSEILIGQRTKQGPQRDGEGHRTYRVTHLVKVDPESEGGYAALQTPGLPQPGDDYNFDGDYDPWAFCLPEANVSPHEEKEGESPEFYKVEQIFSTKPKKKCNETQVENPLMEPMRISGDFKFTKEESSFDRFGRPIVTSSWELIRGKDNEWDISNATVNIEQNVAVLELDLCTYMKNRLNMFPLWGLPARCIKLSAFSWEKKFYGQCFYYYTRKFGFDIDWRTFDRNVLDEGNKVLRGKWLRAATDSTSPVYQLLNNPSRYKPSDFIRYADPNGNPGKVVLNSYGLPSGACIDYNNADEQPALSIPIRTFVCVPRQGPDEIGYILGIHVDDWEVWVQAAAGYTPTLLDPEPFGQLTSYIRGNLVTYLGDVYVCIADNFDESPDVSYNWQVLPGGIVNKGVYSRTTPYFLGDVVTESPTPVGTGTGTDEYLNCRETFTGHIHVEKYSEANFLFLGIPSFL